MFCSRCMFDEVRFSEVQERYLTIAVHLIIASWASLLVFMWSWRYAQRSDQSKNLNSFVILSFFTEFDVLFCYCAGISLQSRDLNIAKHFTAVADHECDCPLISCPHHGLPARKDHSPSSWFDSSCLNNIMTRQCNPSYVELCTPCILKASIWLAAMLAASALCFVSIVEWQ